MVIRCPPAKADHIRWLAAVAGGVHGRSAAAGAASTVSRTPLTVIRAPSTASTARTPASFLILARSAAFTPPGTEAMTSGTTRRVGVAPARPGAAELPGPGVAPAGDAGPVPPGAGGPWRGDGPRGTRGRDGRAGR